ncbi:lipid storage droplets surface-binding protein 2-like [Cryptotermes secundus]|uniref:lipid storage droplets surface-binding protein 2-like n=1 Tax=Cryptotermes secundus TaxID=105785 RepID=UPI000CD7D632|nr:lipid storage droplets surface-binding protein 2-like [Cryptotermes secundus]
MGFDIIIVKQMTTTRRAQPEEATTRNLPLFLTTLLQRAKSQEIFNVKPLPHISQGGDLPLVKEPPEHIYETTKCFVNSALSPTLDTVSAVKNYGTQKAQPIKVLSLYKANEMLATRYGNMALGGFEKTAALAEKYLDYYFPATEQELEQENGSSSADDSDKVMRTVHTVGHLSNKFAHRVYNVISSQVKNLNKDSMQQYINSLAIIMHLTNYLSTVNQNLKATTSSSEIQHTEEEKSKSHRPKAEEEKLTIA